MYEKSLGLMLLKAVFNILVLVKLFIFFWNPKKKSSKMTHIFPILIVYLLFKVSENMVCWWKMLHWNTIRSPRPRSRHWRGQQGACDHGRRSWPDCARVEDCRRVPAGVQRAWKLRGPCEIVERGTLGDSWRGRTSSGLGSHEEETPSYGKLVFWLNGLSLNLIFWLKGLLLNLILWLKELLLNLIFWLKGLLLT